MGIADVGREGRPFATVAVALPDDGGRAVRPLSGARASTLGPVALGRSPEVSAALADPGAVAVLCVPHGCGVSVQGAEAVAVTLMALDWLPRGARCLVIAELGAMAALASEGARVLWSPGGSDPLLGWARGEARLAGWRLEVAKAPSPVSVSSGRAAQVAQGIWARKLGRHSLLSSSAWERFGGTGWAQTTRSLLSALTAGAVTDVPGAPPDLCCRSIAAKAAREAARLLSLPSCAPGLEKALRLCKAGLAAWDVAAPGVSFDMTHGKGRGVPEMGERLGVRSVCEAVAAGVPEEEALGCLR